MLIVSQIWYPAIIAPEMGELYLEMRKKFPDDKTVSKVLVRGALNATKEGIHSISIYLIKPGKVKEAMDLTLKRLMMLATIEGFKYETYMAYDLAEAMPLIGLAPPPE